MGGEGGSEALKFVLRNLWTAKKLNILVGVVFFGGGGGIAIFCEYFLFMEGLSVKKGKSCMGKRQYSLPYM